MSQPQMNLPVVEESVQRNLTVDEFKYQIVMSTFCHMEPACLEEHSGPRLKIHVSLRSRSLLGPQAGLLRLGSNHSKKMAYLDQTNHTDHREYLRKSKPREGRKKYRLKLVGYMLTSTGLH